VATAEPTLQAGQSVFNPVSGERATFVRTAASTDGHALEVRWHLPVGSRMAALPHKHPDDAEEFELLEGTAEFSVGGKKETQEGPHRFTVPANTSHVHPKNAGERELVVRQWIEVEEPRYATLAGIQAYFETAAALAHDGKINRGGLIRNPLQFALTVSACLMPDSVLSFPPAAIQVPPTMGAAALAKRFGMEAYHAPPPQLVEPA
jgi:quercetin dioxygenase-like cupin family protein